MPEASAPTLYRTLFVGTLVQESALSVGGNQPRGGFDDVLCRNGRNRPTLRGEGLAGALLRTARTLYQESDLADITADKAGGKDRTGSLWAFGNAHPHADPISDGRHGVGIRQDTGAAAHAISFDVETLPRGTRWTFWLEIDTSVAGGIEAQGIAAASLLEWARGRCWLGRAVARGMGWMRLDGLNAYILTTEHLPLWPNALDAQPPQTLEEFKNKLAAVAPITEQDFPKRFHIPSYSHDWYFLTVEGALTTGEAANGYGWDALSVGARDGAPMDWSDPHFLKPQGRPAARAREAFKPDHPLAMQPNGQGGQDPYIPGSGLRGPLRHGMSRRLNAVAGAKAIRDPNAGGINAGCHGHPDAVAEIFGTTEKSATLLIEDSHLAQEGQWLAALLWHHAEDEFTAGVYESSLFNRVALLRADLRWRLVLEGPDEEHLRKQWAQLRPVLARAEAGHLGVGGNQWRGLGWASWKVESERLCRAGSAQALDTETGRHPTHEQ